MDIPDVIDPVGVGDAFMGGWLHAITLFPDDRQKQLNYSLAAAALKNTIPGDFNLSTEDEILDVMEQRLIRIRFTRPINKIIPACWRGLFLMI